FRNPGITTFPSESHSPTGPPDRFASCLRIAGGSTRMTGTDTKGLPMKRPILALALLLLPCFAATAADPHRTIVIVVDGLRPDYLTTELMPNLVALGETGVVAEAHHAVFPTVTRVNSPSIAT